LLRQEPQKSTGCTCLETHTKDNYNVVNAVKPFEFLQKQQLFPTIPNRHMQDPLAKTIEQKPLIREPGGHHNQMYHRLKHVHATHAYTTCTLLYLK